MNVKWLSSIIIFVILMGCSSNDGITPEADGDQLPSLSLALLDGSEIPSESLKCIYRQSTGFDDALSLQFLYESAPNTLAFYLIVDDPIPATPYSALAGQQGRFEFWAYSNEVGYRDTLANSEVELQLDSLPLPSELSEGDIIFLKGNILISEYSLIERPASGIPGTRLLPIAAQSLQIACEVEFQTAETVATPN